MSGVRFCAMSLAGERHFGPKARAVWRVLRLCSVLAWLIFVVGMAFLSRGRWQVWSQTTADVLLNFSWALQACIGGAACLWDMVGRDKLRRPRLLRPFWIICFCLLLLTGCLVPAMGQARGSSSVHTPAQPRGYSLA